MTDGRSRGRVGARGTRRAGRRGRGRRGRGSPPRARRRRARRRSRSTSRAVAPSPGRRSRSSAAGLRSSRWYSSLLIASMRSRSASPPSRSNSSRSRRPYLTVIVCQPAASNIAADPAGGDVGHDAVERLAVEVDDPQHLAEARDHRVDERLPDRALVELGVAERARPGARPAARRSGRRRSGGRARSRSSRWRRSRPSRSRSRPGRGPWRGSGSSAGRRTRAARQVARGRAGRAGS